MRGVSLYHKNNKGETALDIVKAKRDDVAIQIIEKIINKTMAHQAFEDELASAISKRTGFGPKRGDRAGSLPSDLEEIQKAYNNLDPSNRHAYNNFVKFFGDETSSFSLRLAAMKLRKQVQGNWTPTGPLESSVNSSSGNDEHKCLNTAKKGRTFGH